MMLTNDLCTVSYPVPHRTATSTSQVRSTSVETMCPLSSNTGTVSLNVPSPLSRHVPVSASSGARKSVNSDKPPSNRNSSLVVVPSRSSLSLSDNPGTRNAVCRARAATPSRSMTDDLTKISGSGHQRTRVPVTPFATFPMVASSLWSTNGVNGALGDGSAASANDPGSPRRNDIE
ncbi:unannotated protein [freshwater metagenome]|uniref:Unannotated protein n=1 Tax=freshwater metagenome TaxID=449393 RepID=A0A6J6FL92_9ZZZZ